MERSGICIGPRWNFIDEHFWLSSDKLKTHLYFRQFENKSTWFPAFGADVSDIKIGKKWLLNTAVHGWIQPKNMEFTQSSGKPGGAIDVTGKYCLSFLNKSGLKGLSANIGLIIKSKGFLLEEMNMGDQIGARLGVSVWL
ncbi:hypothetical protein [uncultured Bacteroides sp.]|uniref:hypothetical protein n=1 Tax=uncultured Bacteroides sp. TaxID=162156 RepID=UPI002AA61C81|nr:hypothetical protein [uncultured Bacteroides sp.]